MARCGGRLPHEVDDMLELNIDPFCEDMVEHQGEEEDVQASQKRPPKPPPEERLKSPPPQEKSESKQCSG